MNPLLLIAVVAINAVLIKRRQSARDTNASNATRNEATATNSAFELQGGLADKQDKSVMRASWVTRQNSSRDDDYRRRCVNRRETSATNAAMKSWRHSALMPQGSLADKRDKSVLRAS
jgi:hypothetical protein